MIQNQVGVQMKSFRCRELTNSFSFLVSVFEQVKAGIIDFSNSIWDSVSVEGEKEERVGNSEFFFQQRT
jgi:hypothetical protein